MIATFRASVALQVGDEVTGVGALVDGVSATVAVFPRRPGMPLFGQALTAAEAGALVVVQTIEGEVIAGGEAKGQGQGEGIGAEAAEERREEAGRGRPGGLIARAERAIGGYEAAATHVRVQLARLEAVVHQQRAWIDRLGPVPDRTAPAEGQCPRCQRGVARLVVDDAAVVIVHADSAEECRIPIHAAAWLALLEAPRA